MTIEFDQMVAEIDSDEVRAAMHWGVDPSELKLCPLCYTHRPRDMHGAHMEGDHGYLVFSCDPE